jgi:hypothetical protein
MVMKKAFGGDSPLRKGAGRASGPPDLASMMAVACSMFYEKEFGPLGFSRWRD